MSHNPMGLHDMLQGYIYLHLCTLRAPTLKYTTWGLAHTMSLTELALLDSRRPLPLEDVIGLIYYYY
jgi:hypothetical protein